MNVKHCGLTIIALALIGLANADTSASAPEETQITVNPGEWAWTASVNLSGLPMADAGTRCIEADEARFTLNELASQVEGGDCRFEDVQTVEGGYTFRFVCTGDYAGDIKGSFLQEGDNASLMGEGKVSLQGVEGPVTLQATATREGDCS